MFKTFLPSLSAMAAFSFSGCMSTAVRPQAYDIHLAIDKPLEMTALEVDFFGANAQSDLRKWASYPTIEYWQPNNAVRRDAPKVTLSFGPGKPVNVVFPREDPAWRRWLNSGASYLVVIADLPGVLGDPTGNADSRRLIVPLDKKLWKRNTSLEVLIQESGIRLLTKQKDAKF